jgi:hypothetical protein
MELNAFALVVLRFGLASSAAKDARGSLSHGLLPVGNLDEVNVEILCDLLDRFDALECLKRNAGFELGVVSSSFTFHFVCVRFGFNIAPTYHNHRVTTSLICQVCLRSNYRIS